MQSPRIELKLCSGKFFADLPPMNGRPNAQILHANTSVRVREELQHTTHGTQYLSSSQPNSNGEN